MHNIDSLNLSVTSKRTLILLSQSYPNYPNVKAESDVLSIGHVFDLIKEYPEYFLPSSILRPSYDRLENVIKKSNLKDKKQWLTLILYCLDRRLTEEYQISDHLGDLLDQVGRALSHLAYYSEFFPVQVGGKDYSQADIHLLAKSFCSSDFGEPSMVRKEKAFFDKALKATPLKKHSDYFHFSSILSLPEWLELANLFNKKKKSLSKRLKDFAAKRHTSADDFLVFSAEEIADYLFTHKFNSETAHLLILTLPEFGYHYDRLLEEINKRDRAKLEKEVKDFLDQSMENLTERNYFYKALFAFLGDDGTEYFEKMVLKLLSSVGDETPYLERFLRLDMVDFSNVKTDYRFLAKIENNMLFALGVMKLAKVLPINQILLDEIGKRKAPLFKAVKHLYYAEFPFFLFKSYQGKRIFDYFTDSEKLHLIVSFFQAKLSDFKHLSNDSERNALKDEDFAFLLNVFSQNYIKDLSNRVEMEDLASAFGKLIREPYKMRFLEYLDNWERWSEAILTYAQKGFEERKNAFVFLCSNSNHFSDLMEKI